MDERERLSRNDFINFNPHSILARSLGKTCIIGSHKNDILWLPCVEGIFQLKLKDKFTFNYSFTPALM